MTPGRLSRSGWWVCSTLAILAGFGAWKLGFDLGTFKSLGLEAGPTLSKYSHPSCQDMPRLLKLLAETIAMGVFGTVLSVFLALASTVLAARNIAPSGAAFVVTRQILNFLRSMPDPLIALVLVQGMGLGPFPGAVALGLHSGGFIGKTLSERVERVDPKVLDGLKSCGASWFQIIRFGAWPMISRELLGESLFILDRNIRVAATLGIVGAGGIGVELMTALRTFHESEAATVIVLVMALVIAVDFLSTFLRKRMA